jgi:CBS domain-containing protein
MNLPGRSPGSARITENGKEQRRSAMTLKDVMTPGVEVIAPEATLQQAAAKMRRLNIGPLPVCDGDQLVGMLTDRDITVRAVAEGCDPTTTTVREAMTPDIAYCFEDQAIADAVQMMERYQIRRLPILSRAKRLVGMVSLGDLAVSSGNETQVGETLKQVSEPAEPRR